MGKYIVLKIASLILLARKLNLPVSHLRGSPIFHSQTYTLSPPYPPSSAVPWANRELRRRTATLKQDTKRPGETQQVWHRAFTSTDCRSAPSSARRRTRVPAFWGPAKSGIRKADSVSANRGDRTLWTPPKGETLEAEPVILCRRANCCSCIPTDDYQSEEMGSGLIPSLFLVRISWICVRKQRRVLKIRTLPRTRNRT